jgi:hypothetical protein
MTTVAVVTAVAAGPVPADGPAVAAEPVASTTEAQREAAEAASARAES